MDEKLFVLKDAVVVRKNRPDEVNNSLIAKLSQTIIDSVSACRVMIVCHL